MRHILAHEFSTVSGIPRHFAHVCVLYCAFRASYQPVFPEIGLGYAGGRRQAEHECDRCDDGRNGSISRSGYPVVTLKPASFVLFLFAVAAVLALINISLWSALKTSGIKLFNEL